MFYLCSHYESRASMSALAVQVTPSPHPVPAGIADAVAALLSAPEAELDYARAKVALDFLVDPGVTLLRPFVELDRLTAAARDMAGAGADEAARLRAVRAVIYEAGPWNEWRRFDYDHDDFRKMPSKLLSHYLTSRRGNCVSMPILFLILADRLRIDVSLAMAANHLFVRWRNENGKIVNLETTSGANPARDEWLRQTVG